MDQFANISPPQIQVLAPGLVFMKNALNQEQQIWLAEYAVASGYNEVNGFWTTLPSGERVLNNDTGRGRIYDTIQSFHHHDVVLSICNQVIQAAQSRDSKLPDMNPTHLLLLYYATQDGMYWHKDSDPNDGDNDHPIVSISIGNSCSFGYKLMGRAEEYITLESGDILVWGGPNRMLLHCVESVQANTCPSYLPIDNVRLNFTYRDAPNVIGKESLYKQSVENTYSTLMK